MKSHSAYYSPRPLIPALALLSALTLLTLSPTLSHAQTVGIPMGWGFNGDGNLGDGTFTSRLSPVAAIGVTDIIQVSHGSHTLLLKADGTVWAMGSNTWGELGLGAHGNSTPPVNTPHKVLNLTNIIQVSVGNIFSLALKSDGTVWSWGHNAFGQLGLGFREDADVPNKIPSLTGVVKIAAMDSVSFALKSDGTVWAWGADGADGYAQLGLDRATATDQFAPIQIKDIPSVVQIWNTGRTAFVLTVDGDVWCWGDNFYGGLGLGDTTTRYKPVKMSGMTNVVQISSAFNSAVTLFLKSDGTVWGCGSNEYGQVVDGAGLFVLNPIPIPGLSNVVQVFGANLVSYVLKQDGTVLSWGFNNGNLGDGTNTHNPTPKPIPGLSGINYIDDRFALIAPPLSANFSANTTLTYATASLPARLTNKRFANPLNWQKVRLQIDGQEMGSARTNANGIAKTPLTTKGL